MKPESVCLTIVQGHRGSCPPNDLGDLGCKCFPEAVHISLRMEHNSDRQEGSIVSLNPVPRLRAVLRTNKLDHGDDTDVQGSPVCELQLRALVQGSSLGESSLCFSQSSSSLVSRSDWEMRSKANAPVKRSS